jgi:hypothetical protein
VPRAANAVIEGSTVEDLLLLCVELGLGENAVGAEGTELLEQGQPRGHVSPPWRRRRLDNLGLRLGHRSHRSHRLDCLCLRL